MELEKESSLSICSIHVENTDHGPICFKRTEHPGILSSCVLPSYPLGHPAYPWERLLSFRRPPHLPAWQGDLPFAAVAAEPAEAAGMKAAAEIVPPSGSSSSAGRWEGCILPVSHQDLQTVDLKQDSLPVLNPVTKGAFSVRNHTTLL